MYSMERVHHSVWPTSRHSTRSSVAANAVATVTLIFLPPRNFSRSVTIGCFTNSVVTVDIHYITTLRALNILWHYLLLPPTTASQHYNLRCTSTHRQISERTGHLADDNFITRLLYKDCYWTFISLWLLLWILLGISRVYIHPLATPPRGCSHPSHLKTPPGCTLPAPPIAGSPCNHWILQHVCFKGIILFRISGVNFEVSSCTKFQIFRGLRPEPLGELTALPQPLAGGKGLAVPSQGPYPAPPSALRALGLRPLPVTHTHTKPLTLIPG